MTADQIQQFLTTYPSAKRDELMALHTYLKIGGPAKIFFVAETADETVRAVQKAKELGISWAVIGGGSNLLVSDDGFDGVVIRAADRSLVIEGTNVTAGAGAFTGLVAKAAADAGLAGFEWGVGVPGTIGGATYGDAGCFGGEMREVVSSVDAFDPATGARVVYSNADCGFGYRDSRFKREPHVILRVTLFLKRGDVTEARSKIEDVMRGRKDTQPQGAFSAGCMFKNFDYADESAVEKLQREGGEIPSEFLAKKRIPAGWLIDKLGLKGFSMGKAQVSPVHGNFLVNLGGAKAQDVIALSSYVKMKVRDELGILLEDEVQYLGF